jgi:hypothetical protein
MEKPGADFRPLIEALEALDAEPGLDLQEQLARLEMALVSAEINPNPIEAIELSYSLKALQELNADNRAPARGTADLASYFE